jgi:metallo-beta-lactamase family protein
VADAEKALSLFESYSYNEEIEILDGVTISFLDAGHLLGSSSIYVTITEKGEKTTLLFSGDIGNTARPLIRDPQKPKSADYVIVESTYGDRLHGERPDYETQFTKIIQETLDRGGNVVIPSFAIGRTQEILYLIRNIKTEGLVKNHGDFPVFVDSPLAIEATGIYASGLTDFYDEETLDLLSKNINPITFKSLNLAVTSDDSRAINENMTPKVIISASGMCEAGRIRHHLKHNLWRKESTVLFVGYQSEGTLGRRIIDGEKLVNLFGEEIAVRAHIETIAGISGHADKNMLLDWLGALEKAPRRVFVNHGGDSVCDDFAKEIKATLGYEAIAPFSGDVFDLVSGECVEKGIVTRVTPRIANTKKRASVVFERLLTAGRHLMNVIEQNRGGANKDLARFTSQIEALCDKYERKDYSKKK